MIQIYVDASGGKQTVGLGTVVFSDGEEIFRFGTTVKSGRSSTEAELLSVFLGIDILVRLLADRTIKRNDGVLIHTDSKATTDCIYKISETKNKGIQRLAKRIVKELNEQVDLKTIKFWRFLLIKSSENKADEEAKIARRKWISRTRVPSEQKNSGRS